MVPSQPPTKRLRPPIPLPIPRARYGEILTWAVAGGDDIAPFVELPKEDLEELLTTQVACHVVRHMITSRGSTALRNKEFGDTVATLVSAVPNVAEDGAAELMQMLAEHDLDPALEALEKSPVADKLNWKILGAVAMTSPKVANIFLRRGYGMSVHLPMRSTPYILKDGKHMGHLLATREGMAVMEEYQKQYPERMDLDEYGPWLLLLWQEQDRDMRLPSGHHPAYLIQAGADPWKVIDVGGDGQSYSQCQPAVVKTSYAQSVVQNNGSIRALCEACKLKGGFDVSHCVPGLRPEEKPKNFLQFCFDRAATIGFTTDQRKELVQLKWMGADPNQPGHKLYETLEPWLNQFWDLKFKSAAKQRAAAIDTIGWVDAALELGMKIETPHTAQGKWPAWEKFYKKCPENTISVRLGTVAKKVRKHIQEAPAPQLLQAEDIALDLV